MTKAELIEAMAAKSGLTKITLTGFGSFGVSRREAREGRNPKTGLPVKIAARNSVSFKAGSKLKESVNK